MFSDPQNILNQIAISQGSTVCDIGAGSGFYTLPLSVLVGDNGKVYAVDIQKDLLTKVANEARANNRHNVEVVWGDVEKLGGTKLRENGCDMVILANTLFQLEKREVCIDEIRRILKPGGRILLVDWADSFNHLGPHPDQVITQQAAKQLFEKKGFVFERTVDTGIHHYGMILKKA